MELLTRGAFYLAMVLVCARVAMLETIRDPMLVGPGSVAAPRGVGPASSLFLDLMCCVPALLILLRRVMDSTYVLRWGWSHVVMGVLGLWAMASRFWAADKFAAMVASADLAAAFVLIWAGTQLVRSHARLRIVAGMALGLLLVLVAEGLNKRLLEFPVTVRSWYDRNSDSSRLRYMREQGLEETDFRFQQFERKLLSGELRGFSNSPNTYAAMLVLTGLISIGILMQRLKDRDGIGWVVVIGIGLIGAGFALWHTHSRTAAVTPIFGVMLMVASARLEPWMARRPRMVFAGAVVLFFLGVAAVVGHGLAHGNLVEKSLTYRWYYWTGAARIVVKHPVLGVGWANFGWYYPEVRLPIASEEVQDPHNFIVRFFAELGIVGGLLAIAWMVRLWWEMTRPGENSALRTQHSELRKRGIWSLAAVAGGAAVLNLIVATDWDQDSPWLILQTVGAAAGGLLLLAGLVVGAMRSIKDGALDDRPAPWVLRSMQVGIGIFLLHNLIDFSLFETGPLMLFAFLVGSVLGVKQPSVAGRVKRTGVAVGGLTVAVILWLGAAARLWLPTLFAELAAARGDDLFRSSVSKDRKTIDLSKLDAAFAAYQEALREQPLNGEYAWKATNVLLYKNAPANLVRQMIDAAIAANPRAGKYYVLKAQFELNQSKPEAEAVIKPFQEALGLSPADVGLRLEYAAALDRLGDKDFSREQYREALRRDDELPRDEPKRLTPKKRKEIEGMITR
jgi:O-antigen ligase